MRGPLMLASRIRTPLIALRYSPSTVSTVLNGSCRSNPADTPKYCGNLKLRSLILTPTVPACPAAGACWPAHAVGSWLTFSVKAGVAASVQLNRTRPSPVRSEEHTSELQSQSNLVCRLLLEKKKQNVPQGGHRY